MKKFLIGVSVILFGINVFLVDQPINRKQDSNIIKGILVSTQNSNSANVKEIPHYQAEIYGDFVYYINNLEVDGDGGSIYRYHISDNTNDEVVKGDVLDFVIYGNRLFYNSSDILSNNALFVLDLKYDDKPMKISSNAGRDLVFWKNYIYYTKENANSAGVGIIKIDLNDYNEEIIYSHNAYNIEINQNRMYFIRDDDHLGSGNMFASDLNEYGDFVSLIQIGNRKPSYFKTNNNDIYYRVGGTDPKLYKSSIDGLNESLITEAYDAVCFTIINNLIYFTNDVFTGTDGLYKMTLNGDEVELVIQGIYAKNIILFGEILYFYDNYSGKGSSRFYKLNLLDLSLIEIDNL
jgi:hypothetical protein